MREASFSLLLKYYCTDCAAEHLPNEKAVYLLAEAGQGESVYVSKRSGEGTIVYLVGRAGVVHHR